MRTKDLTGIIRSGEQKQLVKLNFTADTFLVYEEKECVLTFILTNLMGMKENGTASGTNIEPGNVDSEMNTCSDQPRNIQIDPTTTT